MTTDRQFDIGLRTFGEITADPARGRPIDLEVRLRGFIDVADQAGLDVFGVGGCHRPDFDKILWEHEILGHGRFLAQIGLGGLALADTARSAELLATEVLPVIRRETHTSSKEVT